MTHRNSNVIKLHCHSSLYVQHKFMFIITIANNFAVLTYKNQQIEFLLKLILTVFF